MGKKHDPTYSKKEMTLRSKHNDPILNKAKRSSDMVERKTLDGNFEFLIVDKGKNIEFLNMKTYPKSCLKKKQ